MLHSTKLSHIDDTSPTINNKNFFLRPGDKVHVIAPSTAGNPDDIYIVPAFLDSLGFKTIMHQDIFKAENPFYANSDTFRTQDFIDSLIDDSKVIWCIRGGTGAIRMVPLLNLDIINLNSKFLSDICNIVDEVDEDLIKTDELLQLINTLKRTCEDITKSEEFLSDFGLKISDSITPKILVGFSDVTVLHLYLQNKYDWPSIHGPMIGQIVNGYYDNSPESVQELLSLLSGEIDHITLPPLTPINNIKIDKNSGLNAKIVGGNATLLDKSIGTDWEINTKDKIVFLEDVGDYAYKVALILDHMKQAGIFENAKAVIFGDFTEFKDNETDENTDIGHQQVLEIKRNFAESLDIPVFTIEGIGHGSVNHPLPLNTNAVITLSTSDDGQDCYTLSVDNVWI